MSPPNAARPPSETRAGEGAGTHSGAESSWLHAAVVEALGEVEPGLGDDARAVAVALGVLAELVRVGAVRLRGDG